MHPQAQETASEAPQTTFVATGVESGFGSGALARRRLGAGSLVFFTVSASAPMTVLAGGVVATLATTGVIGTPLSFAILAVVLGLFAVGYAAMSRHVVNAGVFYAYIAQGLNGAWGVSASFVALVAYNAIQIGLYGLFGAAAGGFIGAKTGLDWPWEAWAFIAMAVVAVLGLLRVDLNAKVLSVLLVAEIAAVLLFDVGSFANPAGGHVSFAGLNPSNLFVAGLGGVFAFGIAAFTGFESAGDYAEEARDPRRTVGRALALAVAITGVLYTLSAWALTVGVGPDKVVDAARDPNSGIPFSLMADHFGNKVADAANILLLTSVFAALLSFHNTVARYFYAAGRERVLPRLMARTGTGTAAPIAGSLAQTILAIVVVFAFWMADKDPITQLFTWLSYVAAVGIILLMLGTSIAVIRYLNNHGDEETLWQKTVAPALATILLALVTFATVANANSLLGVAKGAALTYVLPGIVIVALIAGLVWGSLLKSRQPNIYAGIGKGGPTEELVG
jgi:amino acid transporter